MSQKSETIPVWTLNTPGGGPQPSASIGPSDPVHSMYTGELIGTGPISRGTISDAPADHKSYQRPFHAITYNPANQSYMAYGVQRQYQQPQQSFQQGFQQQSFQQQPYSMASSSTPYASASSSASAPAYQSMYGYSFNSSTTSNSTTAPFANGACPSYWQRRQDQGYQGTGSSALFRFS